MTERQEVREIWASEDLSLEALALVDEVWERTARGWPLACRRGCSLCCSDRLAVTTLEGRALARALKQGGRSDLLARAASASTTQPTRPAATFNELAWACLNRQEPPAEDPPPVSTGACPLLEDGLCAAYQARPLGCRVMVSRRSCREGDGAWADPWWLTLATALHQVVEHLDLGGGYGLLPQVLSAVGGGSTEGLLTCRVLPGIPAPPEHQTRLQEVLAGLFRSPLRGKPLGWWLQPPAAR